MEITKSRKSSLAEAVATQMARIPTVPELSSEYLAQLLSMETEKRKKLVNEFGITAYLGNNVTTNPTRDINKTFLKNTIQSVESHNRREETADCWRQHQLQRRNVGNGINGRSSHEFKRKREVSSNLYQEDRQYWAELKAKKATQSLLGNSSSSSSFPASSQFSFAPTGEGRERREGEDPSHEEEEEEEEENQDKEKRKTRGKEKKKKKKKKEKKREKERKRREIDEPS